MRPRRCAQNGARAVWALPVTGSSSMPKAGKKPRETKSYPREGSSAAAVTITPRLAKARRAPWSGSSSRTVFSSASSMTRSPMCAAVSWTERIGAPPSAWSTAGGAGTGVSEEVGKSIVIVPSTAVSAVRTPQRAEKRISPSARPAVASTWAVASVAWPHMSTSAAGVNQRSAQSASPPGGRGWAKAVSERFTSDATCWSQASGGNPSSRSRTPAGLPWKGRSVKASTIRMRMDRR